MNVVQSEQAAVGLVPVTNCPENTTVLNGDVVGGLVAKSENNARREKTVYK